MFRLPIACGIGILCLAFAVGTSSSQQDTKKDKDTPKTGKTIKGQVPAGWGKTLNLTKEQTKSIQKIDVDYKTKIAELTAKIEELKEQSKIEMAKVLTDEQRAKLVKLAGLDAGEKTPAKDKKDEKKADEKK